MFTNGANFTNGIKSLDAAGFTLGTDATVNGASTITYRYAAFATAISITTTGTLSAFTSCSSIPSAVQSYTVSGNGLTANLVITPPTGYEISLVSNSAFSTSAISLTPSSGTVPTTTIYVRLNNATAASYSGNITNSSTGATTQNVAVNGTVNANPIAITSASYA